VDTNLNTNFSRNIEVQAGGGTYRTWGSVATGQLSGTLTGSGNLRRTDGDNATCTLTLNGDASAFNGTFTNERGVVRLGSTNWSGTSFVQTDGNNILRLNTAGDTSIKSLTSDRDVIVPFGSRLNIITGTYTTVGAGSTYNGFWAQGTASGAPAATGEITSSSGTLTVTNGAPTGNLTTTDNRLRVKVVDFNGS
jgi:fibronectin-binding autotransporter adhesin